MEWYILDSQLRRDSVIEGFESFIWTERYNSWGDFQILIISTPVTRNRYQPGLRLGMMGSSRIMTIETVQDNFDEDGTKKLTITGRSIEAWLDDRAAMPALAGTETAPKWTITDTPGNIARYLFNQICVLHILNANDVIPFYHSGSLLPAGTLPEPSSLVTMEFEPNTLYFDLQTICQTYNLGFRLIKDGDTGNVYFEVYTGFDRTSDQTVSDPVIFSQALESVTSTTSLTSNAGFKNVAYVFAQNGAAQVYAQNYSDSTPPSERRVMIVDASDIDLPAGASLNIAMAQRGLQELQKNQQIYVLDGQVNQLQPYIYGMDYELGDLVEERSADGVISAMLVTEQIFISDQEGERSYPTLMLFAVATAGSWDAEPAGEYWDDVVATEVWDDI